MADTEETALIGRAHPATANTFDVLEALQSVAKAELAKGPGLASLAWANLANVIAELLGDEPIGKASPVVGRQPVAMPPGYKHPIPPKGGAQPLVKPAPSIKEREDVAAELARVKRGGKP